MSDKNCLKCGANMLTYSCPGGCFVADWHEVDGLDCLRNQLATIDKYVRSKHNGYNPKARAVMPGLKEPTTTLDAIRELVEEGELLVIAVCALADTEKETK